MRKKIFSVLFAVVLAVSLILVPATVSTAATVDYNAAVIKAADRLVEMQNPDGGFKWQVDPGATTGPGSSDANILGITAMGILKAYEQNPKLEYRMALAKAYVYATTNTAYYAYPDVTFLVWLADAAEADASLLVAIDAEVQDIRTLAESIWNARLTRDGGGDPVVMAEYELGVHRNSPLAFWDLEAAVKAALALDPHFGTNYGAQALAIADVMYANLQSASTYYFDMEDSSELYYALALGGAIEAFSELGVYPTETRMMTDLLISNQHVDGYWDQGGDVDSDKESVQATAYAVMALVAQGDTNALVAAQSGSDWLVNTQDPNGGWYPGYVGATLENLEVDSEAAWALAVIAAGSTSVDMTASSPGEIIGISVLPTEVPFDSIVPGFSSDPITVTVTNEGNVSVNLDATIGEESHANFYTDNLAIDSVAVSDWSGELLYLDIDPAAFLPAELVLTMPSGTAAGDYTATLVFWAIAK